MPEAWFLYPDDGKSKGLRREEYELDALSPNEVRAAPLYGCWEGNMGHAIEHQPIDLCHTRSEPRVVLGNAGVLRVLEAGSAVAHVAAGDDVLLCGNSEPDQFGYPKRIYGYDSPNTMGLLATEIKLDAENLVRIPADTRFTLPQWAAFSVRYITAWSNWRLALGTFRLQVTEEQLPHPNVWGWGGGTTLAELDLARRFGCKCVMLSGDPKRRETISKYGLTVLDRSHFGGLNFDEKRYASDPAYRRAYNRAESGFLSAVRDLTSNEMVHIFVDHIGSAVFPASRKALSRQGVMTTAGWKTGMTVSFLRAMECIQRHQHINTHYASRAEAMDAIAYAEREGWMPEIDERIYSFNEIPEMAERFNAGELGMFPIYAVAGESH